MADGVVPETSNSFENDPYHLKDYASDVMPPDGGKAPLPKTAEPPTYHDNRIYVSNIPFSFRDQDLIDLFSRFGSVLAAMIVCNERGSKGFGFITMDSIESCERARYALHGTRILGRVIEVRKATPLAKAPRFSKRSAVVPAARPPPPPPKTPKKKGTNPIQKTFVESPAVHQHQSVPVSTQAAAIGQFLAENPMVMQNFLMSGYGYPVQQPGFFGPPLVPSDAGFAVPQSYMPCAVMPPQDQTQTGYAFTISSIQPPPMPFMDMGYTGADFLPLPQEVYEPEFQAQPAHSLNNTMNNTLLNSTISKNFMHIQDQMVNFLNLDGTFNATKISSSKSAASMNSSVYLSTSGSSHNSSSYRKPPPQEVLSLDEGVVLL